MRDLHVVCKVQTFHPTQLLGTHVYSELQSTFLSLSLQFTFYINAPRLYKVPKLVENISIFSGYFQWFSKETSSRLQLQSANFDVIVPLHSIFVIQFLICVLSV